MNKYLIYGLYCPFTDNLHYVGKSSSGMARPKSHMTGLHAKKIGEWVEQLKFLGYKPIIKILEECSKDNLLEKEKYWIQKSQKDGAYLLNIVHNKTEKILASKSYEFTNSDIKTIAKILKETRNKLDIRQEDLCKMAGITRPTLYLMEKGNTQIVFNNLKKVLNILGFEIVIRKITTNIFDDAPR
jgi:DNA-binding XRE family transcriptional regulator